MLRWPGGKGKLCAQYAKLLPAAVDRGVYRELAVGGGAVFFAFYAGHRPAVLADVNPDLIGLYTVLRDDVESLIAALRVHQERFARAVAAGNAALASARDRGLPEAQALSARNAPYDVLFFETRRLFNTAGLGAVERAALTVALSKTCLNGLWRVNKKLGAFNAPPGKHYDKTGRLHCPTILDERNLRAVSGALAGVQIVRGDMVEQLDRAEPGDLVFIDPPYIPLTPTASFTSYTAGGFTDADQVRLAEGARRAAQRGVRVAIANSETARARELYDGFDIQVVHAPRSINRDGDGRGPVAEILVRTWTRRR